MRMQWRDLLFVHWPVEVATLRALVPGGLEIDTFGDTGWVGLVPFTMRGVLPHPVKPVFGIGEIGAVSAFHECNVRTYVTRGGEPGVWFFSLDAASRLAVWGARRFWNLPYFNAEIELDRRGDEIDYRVARTDRRGQTAGGDEPRLHCRWRAGTALPRSVPGDLTHFLTERYCLYARDRAGGIRRGAIWHEPWRLREAAVEELEDTLVTSAGITVDPAFTPLAHHADRLDVLGWTPRAA